MGTYRKEHLNELIKNLAGEFFVRESNFTSLLTVTRVELSEDTKYGRIYMSVLPESKETESIHFAKRKLKELRAFLQDKIRTHTIPFFEVHIDMGEKNRVLIDKIEKNLKKGVQ